MQNEPVNNSETILEKHISNTSRLLKQTELIGSVFVLLSVLLGLVFLAVCADHWFFKDGLNIFQRCCILGLLTFGIVFFIYRRIVPLFLYSINPLYCADLIEHSAPSLKNSLINWLLLREERTEHGKTNAMTERMIDGISHSAAAKILAISPERAVDSRWIVWSGIVLLVLICAFIGYLALSPKSPLATLERILLPFANIDRPQAVEFRNIQPGDVTALQGERLTVSAHVAGKSREPVYLVFSTQDGQAVQQQIPMSLPENKERFEADFPPGKSGFVSHTEYWLAQGESRSKKHTITVHPAASVEVVSVRYQYPLYTGLKEKIVDNSGDIKAVEGTNIRMLVRSTLPLEKIEIVFDENAGRLAMLVPPDTPRDALKDWELKLLPVYKTYSFKATDTHGYENRRSGIFQYEVLPDEPPKVQWADTDATLKDVAQLELALNETLDLPIQAEDPDFGLRHLRFKIESGNKNIKPVELLESPSMGPTNHQGQIKAKTIFCPQTSRLSVGDTAEIWVEAADTKLPNPNVAESKRIKITVAAPKKDESKNNKKEKDEDQQEQKKDDHKEENKNDKEQNSGKEEQKNQDSKEQEKSKEKKDDKKDNEQNNKQNQDENKEQEKKNKNKQSDKQDEKQQSEQDQQGQQGDQQNNQQNKGENNKNNNKPGQEQGENNQQQGSEKGDVSNGDPSDKEQNNNEALSGKNNQSDGHQKENGGNEDGEDSPKNENPSDQNGKNSNTNNDENNGENNEKENQQSSPNPETQDGDAIEKIAEQMKKEGKLKDKPDNAEKKDGEKRQRDDTLDPNSDKLNSKGNDPSDPKKRQPKENENNENPANAQNKPESKPKPKTNEQHDPSQCEQCKNGQPCDQAGSQDGNKSDNQQGNQQNDQQGNQQDKPQNNQQGNEQGKQQGEQQNNQQNQQQDQQNNQQQASQSNQSSSQPTDNSNGKPSDSEPQGGSQSGQSDYQKDTPKDEANLEYAQKVTNLVLQYLEDQLQDKPSDELLKKLGWNENQLRQFYEKWKQMSDESKKEEAQKKGTNDWLEAIRSLGLRPNKDEKGVQDNQTKTKDKNNVTEAQRFEPPAAVKDKFKLYTEGIGK